MSELNLATTSNLARVSVASGDSLDVRHFAIRQRMSEPFTVELRVVSTNHDIVFSDVIGNEASFTLGAQWSSRVYGGVCAAMKQVRVERAGLATYTLTIRPRAWLMTHRTNFRVFQYKSELEIVTQILGEWGITHEVRCDASLHKVRKFRVQYGESDFSFVCRMLEDAGISFYFEPGEPVSTMVLDDAPETRELSHPLVRYHDAPQVTDGAFVTKVGVLQRVRPAKMTMGDLDYRRRSTAQPRLSAARGLAQESMLEQFDYEPGAFLFGAEGGGSTPSADDRGTARTDEAAGGRRTETRLHGHRQRALVARFESNLIALAPGSALSVAGHPHRILGGAAGMLVVATDVAGEHDADWRVQVEVVSTASPFKPERVTPKPRLPALESATVVGPAGEEIHTDEYGRVRVHFHWDRESARSEATSCWVPTSQPWAGASFGGINLPRIGQEVLVQFLNGDPDRPVVIGRVFTETNPPPDKLPDFKDVAGFMGESTPRIVMGAADDGVASSPTSLLGDGTPMSPSELEASVTEAGPFQAASPTGINHGWHGSGIKFHDRYQQEIVYLQAERDFNLVVNNCWRTNVRRDRAARIGTDDQLEVGNRSGHEITGNQTVKIGTDQFLHVTGKRGEEITKTLGLQVGAGGLHVRTLESGITLRAKYHDLSVVSETSITLVVGESTIVLTPESVTVQSASTVLQPWEGEGTYVRN